MSEDWSSASWVDWTGAAMDRANERLGITALPCTSGGYNRYGGERVFHGHDQARHAERDQRLHPRRPNP